MPRANQSLALSMIVRNGERSLSACLESARAFVDEIVVGDTGSTDATVSIAERFGARVITVEWKDDFAAARNRVLAEHQSDWILQLDADEELGQEAGEVLFPALENDVDGYLLPIHTYLPTAEEALQDARPRRHECQHPRAADLPFVAVHKNARLFRNLPHIRYQGRLHETVGNSILAAGRPIGELQLTIHHFERHIGEKARHEKSLFYRRLAREKLGERPADPQAHLELALLEMDQFHNPQGAATLLQRACALAPENGALCFFHGVALEKSGQHLAAIARFQAAVERRYCTPLLLEYAADGLYNAGIYVEAARMYREARRVEDTACLESKLGLAEMRCGNYGKGRAFLQSAVRREPMNPDNHDRLVTGLLFLDDVSQAARCAEHKLECVPAAERDYHRAAALWSRAGNDCRALHALTSGLVRYPESGLLHEAVKEIEANPAA